MFETAPELHLKVFEELEPRQIARISRTCKTFYLFANDGVLWQRKLKQQLKIEAPSTEQAKALYHDIIIAANFYIKKWNVTDIQPHITALIEKPDSIFDLACHQAIDMSPDQIRAARKDGHMPKLIEAASLLKLHTLLAFLITKNCYNSDDNPLFFAIYSGDKEIIKMLVKAKYTCFSLHLQPLGFNITPLHWAIICQQQESANVLVELGARDSDETEVAISIKDVEGEILFYATFCYPLWVLVGHTNPILMQLHRTYPDLLRNDPTPISKEAANHIHHAKAALFNRIKEFSQDRLASQLSLMPVNNNEIIHEMPEIVAFQR
jgi:hypothetical protein